MKTKTIISIIIAVVVLIFTTLFMTLQGYERINNYGSAANKYNLEYNYVKDNDVNYLYLDKNSDYQTNNEQYYVDASVSVSITNNDKKYILDSISYFKEDLSNSFELRKVNESNDKINVYVFKTYEKLLGYTFNFNDNDYYICGIIDRDNEVEEKMGMYNTLFIKGETNNYTFKSCVLNDDELKYCVENGITYNASIHNAIINQQSSIKVDNLYINSNYLGSNNRELWSAFTNNALILDFIYIISNLLMYIVLIAAVYGLVKLKIFDYINSKFENMKFYYVVGLTILCLVLVSCVASTLILKLLISKTTISYTSFNTLIYLIPYFIFISLVVYISYKLINNLSKLEK